MMPVNGAYHELVVCGAGGEWLGLPVRAVREVVPIPTVTPMPGAPSFIEGMANVRGRVMAVVDLRKRIGRGSAAPSAQARLVVVRLPRALVGLVVDDVKRVQRVPVGDVQPAPDLTPGHGERRFLTGIAPAGQALLYLVDLDAIFSLDEHQHLLQAKGLA